MTGLLYETEDVPVTQNLTQNVLAELRAELGRRAMTLSALADALEVTPTWVSRRFSGKVPLALDELEAVCTALDLTPEVRLTHLVGTGPGRSSGRGPTPSPSAERNG